MLKKYILTLGGLVAGVGLFAAAMAAGGHIKEQEKLVLSVSTDQPVMSQDVVLGVDGDFTDHSNSVEDMAKNSDLIIVASVAEQRQFSPVSVASTLKVEKVIKGSAPDSPIVFQLGVLGQPDDLLEPGGTYFLFLGKQADSQHNTFYVKGGHQGAFWQQDGRLMGHEKFVTAVAATPGMDSFRALEQIAKRGKRGHSLVTTCELD